MGISGLLPLLKSIHKPCNIRKYAGQVIGVDAYGWLHRGAVACAIDLALHKPTKKYVDFSMNRVRMLIHFGVVPYLVFDGDFLPGKAGTEAERATRREESRKRGLEYHQMNKPSQAHLELQKAVDITPVMARELIEELKSIGVQYVVAPYEADAELVYLEKKGIIGGILSEDSDLLVFGAKRLLTKLDQYGDCVEINRADFSACREISLIGWTDDEFRRMAILSGCDYLGNIPGMGLKNAYRLVRKYKTPEKIIRMLLFDAKYHVPPRYLEDFQKAELTFRFQRVYCPQQNQVITLGDISLAGSQSDLACIGAEVEHLVAVAVARGDLDPVTKRPIILPLSSKSSPRTPLTACQSDWKETRLSQVKGNKTIETFLKAQRTPLAELDPNKFTPSPTQEQLLRRSSGASWQSNDPPTTTSTPATSMPLVQAQPPRNRARPSSTMLTNMTTITPAKRRKVLQDSPDGKQHVLGEAGPSAEVQSPFFRSIHTTPGRKPGKSKGTKIQVWSDDLECTTRTAQAKKPTPSALEIKDQSRCSDRHPVKALLAEPAGRERALDSDESRKNENATESQAPTSSTRPLSSYGCGNADDGDHNISLPDTFQRLDQCVKRELATVTKISSFQYQPQATQPPFSQESCKTQQATLRASQSSSQPRMKPPTGRKQGTTPLQRLGLGAIRRSQSLDESAILNHSPNVRRPADVPPAVPAQKELLAQLGQDRIIKASRDKTCLRGSEDALGPESEEDPCLPVSGEHTGQGSLLDLSQFTFSG